MKTAEIQKGAVLAGRYRVRRRLGSGGMATVFLAEDRRLGRDVAVKRLNADTPDEGLRRFDREARLGAALNHPNLVSIFDTIEEEGGALIVMEYVPGRSLAELAGDGPMDPAEALPILRGVAEALDHAHSEGVVHRDVKPGNVLIREDGTVKLADLGIARATDATQITREGKVIGTLPYMAPERREGPGAGGPESDVYSLAALAHELLSGRAPAPMAEGEPIDLERDWPGAPPAVTKVIARGLDPDPGRRQPSAGRLVSELATALDAGGAQTNGTTATVPFEPPPVGSGRGGASPRITQPAPAGGRGPRVAAVLGIALLGLALIAAVGLALGGGDDGGSGGGDPLADAQKTTPAPQAEEPAPAPEPAPEQPAEPAQAPAADAGSAAALDAQGKALIDQGRYDDAIPLLEQAVAASEGSPGLTHAFALFNLGNALRLAGRPADAIPILEQRLQIPNQRETVARELALAQEQAGSDRDEEGD